MCLSPSYFTTSSCNTFTGVLHCFALRIWWFSPNLRLCYFSSLCFCAILSPASQKIPLIYIYNFLPRNFCSLTYIAILSEAILSQKWRKRELKIYLAISENYLKNVLIDQLKLIVNEFRYHDIAMPISKFIVYVRTSMQICSIYIDTIQWEGIDRGSKYVR